MTPSRQIVVTFLALSFWLPSRLNSQQSAEVGPLKPAFERKISGLDLDPALRTGLSNALEEKDYARAETILVTEANRDPKSLRTAGLLEFVGGIFFLHGEYLNSAIAWEKAKAIAPLEESSRFTLAMDYVKLHRPQWAGLELQKLAAEHPANPLYLYWLARLDFDKQKYAEAVQGLNQVIALDPQMMRAYDLLGLCYDYLGSLQDAIANFTRAVELNRLQPAHSPWPNLDMAITQIEMNDLPGAEKNLREAIGYDPRLAQGQYQLGRLFEKQGKYQEAIAALKAAAAVDQAYAEPHYLLGRVYQRLGKRELAHGEIERFQQLRGQLHQTEVGSAAR